MPPLRQAEHGEVLQPPPSITSRGSGARQRAGASGWVLVVVFGGWGRASMPAGLLAEAGLSEHVGWMLVGLPRR